MTEIMQPKTVGLVPVKGFQNALSRLEGVLSRDERFNLSIAMLKDILAVLGRVKGLESLVIVSREPAIQDIAHDRGVAVIEEPPDVVGEGPAVDFGAEQLIKEGVERVLVVPSDLPLAEVRDLETILREDIGAPYVVMAPSDDGGTNAMLKSPPNAIPSRFGPNSLELHIQEARKRNIEYRILKLASLTTDIDSPEDLKTLVDTPGSTLSMTLMKEERVKNRLSRML